MQGTFFICYSTPKGFLWVSFKPIIVKHLSLCLRISTTSLFAYSPHWCNVGTHVESKSYIFIYRTWSALFQFSQFTSLHWKGKTYLKCCQRMRSNCQTQQKDETQNPLPAAPPSWILTFVPLLFHLWPFVTLLPLKTPGAQLGLIFTLSARAVNYKGSGDLHEYLCRALLPLAKVAMKLVLFLRVHVVKIQI